MDHLKKELIEEATEKHEKIYPVSHNDKLEDCFTVQEGKLVFWFNKENQSTSILTRPIN